MSCYYQGCKNLGQTTEHIPPKSFFPKDQREQLLTITSCDLHNGGKSSDDMYVLAQICMNASPSNRAREIFIKRVAPQLEWNNEALRKRLIADAVTLPSGAVQYKVDRARCDKFFSALSYGIIYKACGQSLPLQYRTAHLYHSFQDLSESPLMTVLRQSIDSFYSGVPMHVLKFGHVKALNTTVYSVKIFGVPEFKSSITIVHEFFGVFRVTSMLSQSIGLGEHDYPEEDPDSPT